MSFLFATADGPDFFAVRGVAYNDVLWMRSQPNRYASKVLGIPANASCIKNLGCYKKWCKVSYGGRTGWAYGRYLGEGSCSQAYNSTPNTQNNTSYYNEPVTHTIQVAHVSWGACMLICEDNAFCKNTDHNKKTDMCTLYVNTSHPDYQRLSNRCSNVPSNNWKASYRNDRWSIDCRN